MRACSGEDEPTHVRSGEDAGGGTRTRMGIAPGDFKSPVYTDFTTPAVWEANDGRPATSGPSLPRTLQHYSRIAGEWPKSTTP